MDKHELARLAFEACKQSYSPYSGFRVGAALLTSQGRVYCGCNVENASYGASICAERTAALKAVYEGDRIFKAIAIAGYHGAVQPLEAALPFPCGICRQFLSEFADSDMKVYVARNADDVLEYTLSGLLPNSFGPGDLL